MQRPARRGPPSSTARASSTRWGALRAERQGMSRAGIAREPSVPNFLNVIVFTKKQAYFFAKKWAKRSTLKRALFYFNFLHDNIYKL